MWCGRTQEDFLCRFLDQLQGSDGMQEKTCQEQVDVVQAQDGKGLNNHLSGLHGKKWSNLTNVVKEKLT